ncbi:MAG: NfeD family protein [Tannerella sp.]|jgi:membrane-bound ClpP family serine protease|nr:NfeD family protein [Tannerella sp.]
MILNISIIIAFAVIAIILFLLEIFLFPGVTLAGIGGALFAVGGVAYGYYTLGITGGHVTLGASLAVYGYFFYRILRSKSLRKIALNTNIDSKVVSARDMGLNPGDEGITLSRLAPAGKARFGNTIVEARAMENFVDEQTPVAIVHIEGYQVIVKSIQHIQN